MYCSMGSVGVRCSCGGAPCVYEDVCVREMSVRGVFLEITVEVDWNLLCGRIL